MAIQGATYFCPLSGIPLLPTSDEINGLDDDNSKYNCPCCPTFEWGGSRLQPIAVNLYTKESVDTSGFRIRMVPLPAFKLLALAFRQFSKHGAVSRPIPLRRTMAKIICRIESKSRPMSMLDSAKLRQREGNSCIRSICD